MKILYVEDDVNIMRLFEMLVRSLSHQALLAHNLNEAYAAMQEKPDIALVDIWLETGQDGLIFARTMREQGFEGKLVAVTGLSTPQDVRACYEAGFNDILIKPYTIDQLADVISL